MRQAGPTTQILIEIRRADAHLVKCHEDMAEMFLEDPEEFNDTRKFLNLPLPERWAVVCA